MKGENIWDFKKNKKYKFPDGIDRTIVDIERKRGNKKFTNSDYGCYYVDIPLEGGDKYFEKYYEEILTLNRCEKSSKV